MTENRARPSLLTQKSMSNITPSAGHYSHGPSRPQIKKSRSFTSLRSISTAKLSRTKSDQPSPMGVPSTAVYNPSDHYVPCMQDGCPTHYLLSMLSPSFYSPSKLHGLVNKHGLCPAHAFKDRQYAEAHLKSEHARLRATGGRRNLREVQQLFEQHVRDVVRTRETESRILLHRQEMLLHAKDFKYYQRPCTAEDCQLPWYSIYTASLFQAYHAVDEYGIGMLSVYCPSCAKAELEEVDRKTRSARRRCKTEEEFEKFLDELKSLREVQVRFWENAQLRVMLKKGVKPKIIIMDDPVDDEEKLEGKGVQVVREACSVM